jgi:hypothetical protein
VFSSRNFKGQVIYPKKMKIFPIFMVLLNKAALTGFIFLKF